MRDAGRRKRHPAGAAILPFLGYLAGGMSIERKHKRVWILDDSALQAAVAEDAIARDYDVRVFLDGNSMLEALGSDIPDLLLIDWVMPDVSGLEVCKFVRQTLDAAALPILVLTASAHPGDLIAALDAGANDFVKEPFDPGELTARVSALLRNQAIYAKLAETEKQLRMEGQFREGFIGMLAHDLRQPLNTFVLVNQTLLHDATADQKKLLAMQRRGSDRMGRMVQELLDFARSRPESGLPVERKPLDGALVVQEIVDEVRAGHPDRTVELAVVGDCNGEWDRDRLAQVCSNLLGNAIEHGAADLPIAVHFQREGESVVLSVKNRGTPIPADVARTIFEPFRRGRSARKAGGVGLGLHIVSEIARAHSGAVAVSSDADATVFSVILPVAAAQ